MTCLEASCQEDAAAEFTYQAVVTDCVFPEEIIPVVYLLSQQRRILHARVFNLLQQRVLIALFSQVAVSLCLIMCSVRELTSRVLFRSLTRGRVSYLGVVELSGIDNLETRWLKPASI